MDTAKKILILHASAGHGHEKAAKAIEQACLDVMPASQVQLQDVLPLTVGIFGRGYKKTYLFLIQYFPWLWGFMYTLMDSPWLYFLIRPLRRCVNAWAAKRLENLVLEQKPDVVIATHFLSVEIVSALKRKRKCQSRLIVIVTDYLAHFFWLGDGVDLYAVASEESRNDLMARGVPAQKILVSGIPVEKKFSQAPSMEAARSKLQLEPHCFTALITSGGAGVGSLEALVKKFVLTKKQIQLLTVCGTNKDLLVRLQAIAKHHPLLHVVGFVDNVQELMASSDLMIGKGGGLTVTESLCLGKPMILFGSVPGQETKNASSMSRQGVARVAHSLDEVVRFTVDLMSSPELLKECTSAALRLGRPKAAADIVRCVLE